MIVGGILLLLVAGVVASGFTVVEPNIARVVIFLGRYAGTIRRTGFTWTVPLTLKPAYSLRLRNFESETLKVNDAIGNPVEIAAVVVWRVVDTARAAFDVDDYEAFVKIQSETAIRHMASMYPYDVYTEGQVSLRANADEVIDVLVTELQEHLVPIGVEVGRGPAATVGVRVRRSRPTCCGASRPRPSSRRDGGSSRALSGWSRMRSSDSASATSCSSTRSARRR